MKNFTLSAGFLLLGFFSQAQITEQLSFSINDVEINQSGQYDIVRLAGTRALAGTEHAGKPQLPVAQVNILLPKGARATNVSITSGQQTQFSGTYNIYPAQPPYYPNFGPPPAFVGQDAAIYASNTAFPQEPLLGFSNHGYRDYSFVSVRFIPFSYKPQSGQLYLLNHMSISVTYATITDTSSQSRLAGPMDDLAFRTMETMVKNDDKIDEFYAQNYARITNSSLTNSSVEGKAYKTTDLPSEYGNEVRYIIITNNTDLSGNPLDGNFVQKFQEFADWKTQNGTPAKIVTVNEIRANYSKTKIQHDKI